MDTPEKVLKAMKAIGKPMKSVDIAEAAGISKAETDKAIKVLKAEGLIDSPQRCFYEAK